MKNFNNGSFSTTQPRLFPIYSDNQLERRAVSIFLSIMKEVPEFRFSILNLLGVRFRKKGDFQCFTEIHFKNLPEHFKNKYHKHEVPDGLIMVETSNGFWSALIEAKVDRNNLEIEQIKDYIDIAKENKFNAILTISNQFAALPTHHPLEYSKRDRKGLDLYHLSWSAIITEAEIIVGNNEIENKAHEFLLKEFSTCFSNEKLKIVRYFDAMNKEWPELTKSIRNDSHLKIDDEIVKNTISSWHQEQRDICLKLVKDGNLPSVKIKMPNDHIRNPGQRISDDSRELIDSGQLKFEIDIKNSASPLLVVADIKKRMLICSMTTNVPDDKPTIRGRIGWIVKQLKGLDDKDGVFIDIYWKGRSDPFSSNLKDLSENGNSIDKENKSLEIRSFTVKKSLDLSNNFESKKKFIEYLEPFVFRFYDQIGENLERWVPKPPRMKEVPNEKIIIEPESESNKPVNTSDN